MISLASILSTKPKENAANLQSYLNPTWIEREDVWNLVPDGTDVGGSPPQNLDSNTDAERP